MRKRVGCCLCTCLWLALAITTRAALLETQKPYAPHSTDAVDYPALRHRTPTTLARDAATNLRGGGATLSRLLPILLGRKQCKILMLGLDAAGKTTILYQLKLGEMAATTPTLGVNVETVTYKNIEFMVMDMGGQDKIRALWSHYYEGGEAIIFVVDSADEERMSVAKAELDKLMQEEALQGALLLVYANKQDMPEALSVQQVADALQLQDVVGRPWYIQACSATSGDGITEGLEWLVEHLAAKRRAER